MSHKEGVSLRQDAFGYQRPILINVTKVSLVVVKHFYFDLKSVCLFNYIVFGNGNSFICNEYVLQIENNDYKSLDSMCNTNSFPLTFASLLNLA